MVLDSTPARVGLWNAPGVAGRILVGLVIAFAAASASAQSFVEVLAQADRQGLAESITWRRLLQYEHGRDESSMLDEGFFLVSDGRTNPRAEFVATIKAYFDADAPAGDASPRCRFPARYYWLASKVELPGYDLHSGDCATLENWALFDQTESLSFLLVSGYLGNPASTFGHTLLKFNSSAPDDREGLFDLTLNYGALVPPYENPLLYIFRGLTGRYDAGFSDKYFYTQDLVYARTEFRDMWDHRLDLTDFQRTMIVLHAWEIIGRKFRYYFLDKNCGFRIAELLELVIDEEILGDVGRWYVPVEMFHRLHEIDRARSEKGERPLVESVTFIPSSRRELYHELERLNGDEMDVVRRYAESDPGELGSLLGTIPETRRVALIDGLLAYQQYRITVDRPDSNDVAWKKKREILLARLRMPPQPRDPPAIPELASPAKGFRPSALVIGAARESGSFDYGLVSWSPFEKESVGRNSLEGNELAFFDLSVGIADDAPAVFLDRLDLLRILSLNAPGSRMSGDRALSWQLRARIERQRVGEDHDHGGLFGFGVGRAWDICSRLTTFGMVNAEAHTDSPRVRALPEIGVLLGLSRLRARAGYALQTSDYEGSFVERWEARAMLQLGERFSLHAEVREARTRVFSAGITRYY